MTAISNYLAKSQALSGAVLSAPVRSLDGARALMRLMRRIVGAALVLAAAGLWFSPDHDMTADLALIKLVLSLVAGLAGVALIQGWSAPDAPEVEIDVVRRRVRLVRRSHGLGSSSSEDIVHDCSFAELGHVEKHHDTVTLWDAQGNLLAEVAPTDRATLSFLVAGLRDAGKL